MPLLGSRATGGGPPQENLPICDAHYNYFGAGLSGDVMCWCLFHSSCAVLNLLCFLHHCGEKFQNGIPRLSEVVFKGGFTRRSLLCLCWDSYIRQVIKQAFPCASLLELVLQSY